ncbi:MAG: hypothetical protein A2W90_16660 [Bacteroidetes bacterium GWF2_42_66]|nr:MAG: hypothetical protein A2W92_03955 [Bacteroidetes bacterium GWA2_42_15]OFX96325.1 MAG: hypothetical protein A2W89_05590 [Bacteroidetes bacterium GWE2_42_39]OFY46364.1 MAG: hypothetical protein A2W90_16660 [Bacteroidetes bacterium GWF2_42_66]HAZ03487.1 hypothetical protein [Marinilabiliales bacterium]HBL78249.1 hypothetical protein [Prolixibacteraceae bacterium]
MRRLILSTIPDNFNPQTDIIIGPWSLIGKENLYPEWEIFKFEPDLFETNDEISINVKITVDFAEYYMVRLSNYLNEINKTNYSIEFWRLLILPWLLTLVQTTWDRQLRVNKLLEKYSSEEIEIELVKDNIIWNFKNTLDHQQNGLLKPLYNHWLYSRLIESKISCKWKINWIEEATDVTFLGLEKKLWRKKISEWFSIKFLSSTVYGINRYQAIFFEFLLHLKLTTSDNIVKETWTKKHDSVQLDWNLDWDNLVKATLPQCFKNITLKTIKRHTRNTFFLVGPVLWYDEKIKLKLAREIEKGSKIIVTQHGGSYGTTKVYPFSAEIEYKQYRFFSWGWGQQENYLGNIIPLPSPLLSRNKYKKKNSKIIFVSFRSMLYSYRIHSIPQPIQQLQHRKLKIEFFNTIKSEVKENFYYRPPINEMGSLPDKEYFKEKFPYIKILMGKLHEETMKCKLLIIDHPDTTLNIALAANIPTICFWDSNSWAFSKQSEPYFQRLRDVGILFNNGAAAARKVNEICNNVDGWWQQPSVQKARKDWVDIYARSDKNWFWIWAKTIWELK